MKFLLIAITAVLLVSKISCTKPSICNFCKEEAPSNCFEAEEKTLKQNVCPYSVTDVDAVVNYFCIDKKATNVKVKNVLMIQQELKRDVTCKKPWLPDCPLPPPDAAAITQFGRYFDGNQRAIENMKSEVERIFNLLSLENPYSGCACELKRRIITAMNSSSYGIISCTGDSVKDLNKALASILKPMCDDQKFVEFFANYKMNNTYFTAESALRKCKTSYIDAFYTELAKINAAIENCVTKELCARY